MSQILEGCHPSVYAPTPARPAPITALGIDAPAEEDEELPAPAELPPEGVILGWFGVDLTGFEKVDDEFVTTIDEELLLTITELLEGKVLLSGTRSVCTLVGSE